jgi:hypothetical protein
MNTFETPDRILVVDGVHGIYVPQRYAVLASSDDMATDQQREILLEGPEHPDYWDVWDEILTNLKVKRGRYDWYLEQDEGDVWLVKIKN